MSVITVRTSSNNTQKTPASKIQELLRQSFKLTHQIPLELVNRTTSTLRNPASWNKSSRPTSNDHKMTIAQAAEHIAAQARFPVRIHYAYYCALLKTMDQLLSNPGVPASRGAITLNKSVSLDVEMPRQALLTKINLVGRWLGLADLTIQEKLASGKEPLFWKHTGEASQAFHTATTNRLAQLKPENFVTGVTGPILSDVKNGHVSSAKYTFKIGVPHWNSKLDRLITKPFASGKIESIVATTGNLRGIDRIMGAESARPWLRSLAAQSGNALKQQVNGGSFSTIQTAPVSPLQNSINRFHKKDAEKPLNREDSLRKMVEKRTKKAPPH